MDIGRPAREETIDYYHKYIDLVSDGDIRDILDAQREETLAFFAAIPDAFATNRYAPDKWSVSEVLGHINDAERVFAMRAFWFARGNDAPLPSWDPEASVASSKSAERPLTTHVQEFASIRSSTVDLFRHLPEEAWTRRGIASDNPFTVRALAYLAAGHVTHHLRILEERYLCGPKLLSSH